MARGEACYGAESTEESSGGHGRGRAGYDLGRRAAAGSVLPRAGGPGRREDDAGVTVPDGGAARRRAGVVRYAGRHAGPARRGGSVAWVVSGRDHDLRSVDGRERGGGA